MIFQVGVLARIKEEGKKRDDEILPVETKILINQSNWKNLNAHPTPFAFNYAWKFHF